MRDPVRQSASLDPALRAHGCTLASLAFLAGWASDGEALPGVLGERDALMNHLRTLAGVSTADFLKRGTTISEAQKAFQSLTFPGRLPPRMRLMRGGSVQDDLLPTLRAGSLAVVAVNYGAVQDAGRGVGSFRGGHAVVVGEPSDGMVTVADPLRSSSVRWTNSLLEHAMETFGTHPWGFGRGEAGIVGKSLTFEQAYGQSQADLKAAKDTVTRLTAKLDAQRAQTTLATDERDTARREYAALVETSKSIIAGLERDLAACKEATPPDCTAVTALLEEANARIDAARVALG